MHGSMWRREETRPVGNAVQPGASRRPSRARSARAGACSITRATAPGRWLPVTSHAIRKRHRDRGVCAGVAAEFIAKHNSELVGIRDGAPTTPSVSSLARRACRSCRARCHLLSCSRGCGRWRRRGWLVRYDQRDRRPYDCCRGACKKRMYGEHQDGRPRPWSSRRRRGRYPGKRRRCLTSTARRRRVARLRVGNLERVGSHSARAAGAGAKHRSRGALPHPCAELCRQLLGG
jgi:hypothetical protein